MFGVFVLVLGFGMVIGEKLETRQLEREEWEFIAKRAAAQTDSTLGLSKFRFSWNGPWKEQDDVYHSYWHPIDRPETPVRYGSQCDPIFDHYKYEYERARAFWEASQFRWNNPMPYEPTRAETRRYSAKARYHIIRAKSILRSYADCQDRIRGR